MRKFFSAILGAWLIQAPLSSESVDWWSLGKAALGAAEKATFSDEVAFDYEAQGALEGPTLDYVASVAAYVQGKSKGGVKYITVLNTARVQGLSSYQRSQIYITRGMLNMMADEAELAALLGHEVGHYVLGHRNERLEAVEKAAVKGKIAGALGEVVGLGGVAGHYAVTSSYRADSREHEEKADIFGSELASKAGYDPYALAGLFVRLDHQVDKSGLYALKKIRGTHRSLRERAERLTAFLEKRGYPKGKGIRKEKEFLEGIGGLSKFSTAEGKAHRKKQAAVLQRLEKKKAGKLDKIEKRWKGAIEKKKPLSNKQFLKDMQLLSEYARGYGLSRAHLAADRETKAPFMEEALFQDQRYDLDDVFPIEPSQRQLDTLAAQNASQTLNLLEMGGRIGVGAIPVVGDAIDLYEVVVGRDFFSGQELTGTERGLAALGLLIGSGQQYRAA